MDPVSSALFAGVPGNILTLGGFMCIWLVYQRCSSCNSNCHTSFWDCKSPAVRNKINESKIELVMKALQRHQRNTERGENLV